MRAEHRTQSGPLYLKRSDDRLHQRHYGWAIALAVWFTSVPSGLFAQTADEIRAVLEARVGDISKLQVPPVDEIPTPTLNGFKDPRYAITPEKTRLGKLLFFDPIRSKDVREQFGGSLDTIDTVSCGSCHMGEAASKAGTVIAVGVGGEGRHITNERGQKQIVRAPRADLVDFVPTPQEVRGPDGSVVLNGRYDPIDSPPRVSPSCIGFAFNNRLLWSGDMGEPDFGNNPHELPAGENVVEAASFIHRLAPPDLSHIQENRLYRRLFRDAFPEEYETYLESENDYDWINNDTQFRAISSFLRTVITRDTPWDRFLAGDDNAFSSRQRRGAWLFSASVDAGGANCIACHSGPALNKRLGDEEGLLVNENFQNLGTNEHPLFELTRQAF
ncbi:MAG: cytochrome c peroxidase, partial [Planctomycetota bacterium]